MGHKSVQNDIVRIVMYVVAVLNRLVIDPIVEQVVVSVKPWGWLEEQLRWTLNLVVLYRSLDHVCCITYVLLLVELELTIKHGICL